MQTAGTRGGRRLWPSCLAALVVLAALLFLIQPALSAGAAPAAVGPLDAPVRVRVSPAHDALGGGTLRPGEARHQALRVHNEGTVRFRYDVSIPAVGVLAELILVEIRAVEGVCDADAFAGSSAVVAGPAPMADILRAGGRMLEPGTSELLCTRIELPRDAALPGTSAVTDALVRVSAVQS